jgi:xanthine/CO dehydrogenase XdhC/CoxF family maturation factor
MDLFERIAALRREGQSFALATVVARRAPVSAHLGDRAIVFADGRMEGFVGGACAREIIRQQALESIAVRHGRLVSIRPDASEPIAATAEHIVVPMTCASEGAVDVYVEPFVQARSLIVVGATPVADALARLARGMDYDVVRVVDAGERRDVEPGSASLGINVVSLDDLAGGRDRVQVEVRKGDAVFMSPFTIHRSAITPGDQLRIAASWRYEDALEGTFIERKFPFAQSRVVSHRLLFPEFPSTGQMKRLLK